MRSVFTPRIISRFVCALTISLLPTLSSANVLNESDKLLPSDGPSSDQFDLFGISVAVSGDMAVVGATGDDDDNSVDCGSAYVFRRNGSAWVQEQKLLPSDGAAGDGFGVSVAISGNVAVVGAYGDDDNGSWSGSAYVFRWNGSSWVQEQKLLPTNGATDNRFGQSVGVSGNVAIVGAYRDDDMGTDSGSAFVFRWDGATWAEEQMLLAGDGTAWDQFGYCVSISGDLAVIGAISDDDNGLSAGSAYVYRWNGSSWIQEQKLLSSDGAADDQFGYSVSVFGEVAAIGANGDDDIGASAGSAYVYRWDGSLWVEEQKLLASDGAANDLFGLSVAVGDGVAVVGASNDTDNGFDSGSAYVYRWDGSSWVEEGKLLPSDGATDELFGRSVAVSGDVAVIGAFFDDHNGYASGSAYVFGPIFCRVGYYGPACAECPGGGANACSGHGRCDDGLSGTGVCACEGGYAGESCDVCAGGFYGYPTCTSCDASTTCSDHGTCNSSGACDCDTGYAGAACDECAGGYYGPMCTACLGGASNPCNGHGACDDGIDGTGFCTCNSGWTGSDCGVDVDECAAGHDCDVNATCTNTPGGFVCVCDDGYDGDGTTCDERLGIPTVSVWGLTVLTLLLLAGAKTHFGRLPLQGR